MPTAFLRRSTKEYIHEQSNGQSIDATICRLLNLNEGANGKGLVRRHTPKDKLTPKFVFTWVILDQLRAVDQANPQLPRSELQKKVGETLEMRGLFTMFPDDAFLCKRNQPRWKARFTNALAYLVQTGCVEIKGKAPDAPQQQRGVQYRATGFGLKVIEDIVLSGNRPDDKDFVLRTISSCQTLERNDIPYELAGRQGSMRKLFQGRPKENKNG